ncbi:MAG TPA: tetratricopeptide repeat protein [Nitrospinaceae bacterium]|jgi:tetratricopeptide (TPR) repeat protein|nr:tetratricopeptide repeat protein [Nitrospinaceae bacterium]
MSFLNQTIFKFYYIFLWTFLQVTLSSCTAIQNSVSPISNSLTSAIENQTNKAFSNAKILVSNLANKSSFNTDLEFALQQYKQSKYEVAEFYLKKSLIKVPDNPTAIKLLPWVYFYQHQYGKALTSFKRTKAFYKKDPKLSIGMGWCYLGLTNYERAIEQFEYAKKHNGDIYQIYKGQGFAHLILKRMPQAKENFSKVYNTSQINEIFNLWSTIQENKPDKLLDILPTRAESLSLFTLPIEFPRYQGLFLGLPKDIEPDINDAWNAFEKGKFKKALYIFKNISIGYHSPDAENGLAWSYLKTKEIKEASKLFKGILQTWPNFIGAIQGLDAIKKIKKIQARHADYYFEVNKLGLAEKKYKEMKNKYPNWEYPHIQLGKVKLARNNFLHAREYFLDALDIAPKNLTAKEGIRAVRKEVDSELFLADLALESGDYKKAALLYADYIKEYEPNASSLISLKNTFHQIRFMDNPWKEYSSKQKPVAPPITFFSQMLDKLGLRDTVLNNARPVIPSRENSLAHAYNGLGWSQYYKKKYLKAATKFEIARSEREYFVDSSKGLGLALYNAGQFKEAANALKIVVKLNPDQLDLAYKLDTSILMSWDATSAREYFSKNLVNYPLRSSLYMGLGWLIYRDRDSDLAIEYFLKAISLDPDFALTSEFKTLLAKKRFGWQVYNKFGWAYYEKHDYENAIIMFQNALKEQPNKSETRKGMGYTLNKIGKLSKSVKYLNQALELNNDPNVVKEIISESSAISPYSATTTVRTTLGNILIKQGKTHEAIALFKDALELRPKLAAAHGGLGWAHLALNQFTQSRTAFKTALKIQPHNYLSFKGLREIKQRIANIKLSQN